MVLSATELQKKYPEVSVQILKQYNLTPQPYIEVNNRGKGLKAFRVPLPDFPEDLSKIEGWGLPAKQQKFKRQEIPKKLKALVRSKKSIEDVWRELYREQDEYFEEIKFIQKQWFHLLNGYWFMNNGVPTFITGTHFVYLNYWLFMDGGKTEYRDVNRKFFLAIRHAQNYTKKILYDDKEGKIPTIKDGYYVEVETGHRTCDGVVYPKGRRHGATNMVCCDMYCDAMISVGEIFGIISNTGANAQKHFTEIMRPGARSMPFFFRPNCLQKTTEQEKNLFFSRKPESEMDEDVGLGTIIDWSPTAKSNFYDNRKVKKILLDESGKTNEAEIFERWQQVRKCLGQGAKRNGFAYHPSTVGEFVASGGAAYYNLCEGSKFEEQNPTTGMTATGLWVLYFPSDEGYEGFIDAYGNSIIEDPTPEQAAYINRTIGSNQYIKSERQVLLDKGDPKSIDAYWELVRLDPLSYDELWHIKGDDVGFNKIILEKRISELRYLTSQYIQRGWFEWEDNRKDTRVIFREDPLGPFEVSFMPTPDKTNQRYMNDEGHWCPLNPTEFTHSADTFKFLDATKAVTKKLSNGGGATFWERNLRLDPDNKPMSEWVSNRYVVTYDYRPALRDDFCEHMLMMNVFFGGMMFSENNLPYVNDHYVKRGYAGYLAYEIDESTGKLAATPGFNSLTISKQTLFNGMRDYIENHGHRDRHASLLIQCNKINGLKDMTNYDLFTAGAGCQYGSRYARPYAKMLEEEGMRKDDLSDYLRSSKRR